MWFTLNKLLEGLEYAFNSAVDGEISIRDCYAGIASSSCTLIVSFESACTEDRLLTLIEC